MAKSSASLFTFIIVVLQSQYKLVLPTLIFSYIIYLTLRDEFSSGTMFLYKDLRKSVIFNTKVISLCLLYLLYLVVSLLASVFIFYLFLNTSDQIFSSNPSLFGQELVSFLAIIMLNIVAVFITIAFSMYANRAATIVMSIFFVLLSVIAPRLQLLQYVFPNGYVNTISTVGIGISIFIALSISLTYILSSYVIAYRKFIEIEF
ncbi:hypothetical protein [Streptococcus sp. oral taxon 056]|uniref:hypothetical protein n=1 Tax=Streptococcus sp. oral taxon 056 TaxID=712620 RepID=UPI000FE13F48|nr:hypothetical protein [Streptococcus sp. oral taxon 056]